MVGGAGVKSDLENAAAAFQRFAVRHSLSYSERTFKTHENALDYVFEIQTGLAFELSLGLTNDELHIGYQGFWTYIFPLNEKIDWMIELADGIITNRCRLAIHQQKGVVKKRALESFENGQWVVQYTANEKITSPLKRTNIIYVYNTEKPIPMNSSS